METYFLDLLNNGGPVGILVVAGVLLIGVGLRHKGWLFDSGKSDPPKVVADQLSHIDTRMTLLEARVGILPTRDEFHELQTEYVRMSERMTAMSNTAVTTQHAVLRIENFMIEASQRERSNK